MAALHPIGHIGEPNDIAYGTIYLASDESKFVTGAENIPADDLGEIALEKIKKDEEIIVYCLDIECNASNRAANILEKLGYKNIKLVQFNSK